MKNNFAVIILAAGKGTRMKSKLPKVLHEVGGKPMLQKTIDIVKKTGPAQVIVVVGHDAGKVKEKIGNRVEYAHQKNQLGTADAARVGLQKVKKSIETVVILNGDDSAFYKPQTVADVLRTHENFKNALTFVTLDVNNPKGLGRIIRKNGKVAAIVEEKDATEKEKKVREINDGLYVFQKNWLSKNLPRIKPSPATGEFYLVDLVRISIGQNQKISAYKLSDSNEWHGVNTKEELASANRKSIRRLHIMGISGAGAAAVAGIAQKSGFHVTGCDLHPDSPYAQTLDIKILTGHDKSHVKDNDALVISPAVEKLNPKNPEIMKARELQIPVMTWQKFQGEYLQKDKFVITVAGAFGKSTTTAMISQILIDAGFDPTCEIGAKVLAWDSNFRVGESKYQGPGPKGQVSHGIYVCESDEYNNNFLNYRPDIAVILNVAWDHPDFFKSRKQLLKSYMDFINNIRKDGTLIVAKDNKLQKLSKKARGDIKVITVGDYGKTPMEIIGNFRIQNANAALTVASSVGADIQKAKSTLAKFSGVGRRLEYKGEINGVKFYDDYAVQPYTILKTADALKEKYGSKKVLLVLEPHTFSRIETFYDEFVQNLKKSKVDQIFITDVYAAREKGDQKSLSKKLAKSIGEQALYTGSLEETSKEVRQNLLKFQIICSMGAGNSYKLYNMVQPQR